ncbi:hypothetical protein OBBRIDRAFT_741067 [Obba rivulosa]|uniref:BTB domain-containing protein n=1 Tax=Obba rivulosa TaxID=1052685 RepID=A0A8E2AT28_9APHY|nr:hypothetical protein OBBRIDRAFT_741067 [Obba rivulosa]
MQEIAVSAPKRAKKRTRVDSEASEEEHPPTRSPARNILKCSEEFWYEDGSVVLVAQDTAFRIYRGLLAQHSPVFRDLFTIPQPNTSESVDDCPVVRIPDDPDDVARLLRIFAATSTVSYFSNDQIPFADVAAIIRITHKYQMDQLLGRALQNLKTVFKDTFPDFIRLDHFLAESSIELDCRDAITVVNLAHLTQNLSMLPMALYICCQLAPKDIIAGVDRNGRRERLSQDDIVRCIAGRLKLSQASVTAVFRVFQCSDECMEQCKRVNGSTCRRALHAALQKYGADFSALCAGTMPLDTWITDDRDYFDSFSIKFCSGCWKRLQETEQEEHRRIWCELPVYFGLEVEGWKEKNPVVPK